MTTPAIVKDLVCKALMQTEMLGSKVASASQMQGFLDSIKAWTLPAVGVLYDGRTRSHPSEQAMQPTRSVELHFTILIAVPTVNSMGYVVEDPVDELEAVRVAVSKVKLPNSRPCIFLNEKIIKSNDKLTIWAQKWRVATNVT